MDAQSFTYPPEVIEKAKKDFQDFDANLQYVRATGLNKKFEHLLKDIKDKKQAAFFANENTLAIILSILKKVVLKNL